MVLFSFLGQHLEAPSLINAFAKGLVATSLAFLFFWPLLNIGIEASKLLQKGIFCV